MTQQFFKNRGLQISIKAAITGILILLLLIPAQIVNSVVRERSEFQASVEEEISQSWAKAQQIAPPYLVIPTTKNITRDAKSTLENSYVVLLPESVKTIATINTEYKQRSIYKMPVYISSIQMQGHFDLSQIRANAQTTILWSKAQVVSSLSDIRGIATMNAAIQIGNNQYLFENVDPAYLILENGMAASIDLSNHTLEKDIPFDINLQLKGSRKWEMIALGKTNELQLKSSWTSPSFIGKFLPDSPMVDAGGFSAHWLLPGISRNLPQVWEGNMYKVDKLNFGVNLYDASDNYAKVNRSIKYAILFIGLTFALFLIFELIVGTRVHPLQYILVGIALVVFYTLLLSISEYAGFGAAYWIAALATIGLIVLYCKHLFIKWSRALMVGLFLGLLYGFVYVIIQMKEWNLLAGSVGLFILVAVAMYFSRKIEWFSEKALSSDTQS